MRKSVYSFSAFSVLSIILTGLITSAVPASDKPKPEELVSRHLEALGSADARAALRSLNVEGNLLAKFLRGGSGMAGGPFAMVSTGHKILMEAKFDLPNYPGESYAYDGDRKTLGFIVPGQHSQLEDFLNSNPEVLTDGLIGGVLSTAWPLYDWQARKARIDVDGVKKVEGRELLRATYHPSRGTGDLKIYLFFEPDTFRHIKTIYTQQNEARLGASLDRSSMAGLSGGEANLTVEENFGGFAPVNHLMLPTQWTLQYNQEGSGSSLVEFEMNIAKIQANPNTSGVAFRIQ